MTDLATADAIAESLAQIADLPLERLRLGGHEAADFCDADLIVANPAVPIDHPLLQAAEAAGKPVTTEIGLFWNHCRGQIVGVTGSVGKSTTAAMIHAILARTGRVPWLGGNIGGSLLLDVDRIASDDWVVLELSSFQLERLAALRPRPHVAVVTNFRANHLDRHGTLDAYRIAKQNLLRWQTVDDVAVLNADDGDVANWSTTAQLVTFGAAHAASSVNASATRHLSFDHTTLVAEWRGARVRIPLGLQIPGEHHRQNAAAAAATALAIGVEPQSIAEALTGFRGLPHRLEIIGEVDGRLWVNDSKATTPESAIAALRSFDRPIRLIAGGADKGVDLTRLADEIIRRAASVSLSGRTGPAVANLLAQRGHPAFTLCETFDDSVAAALRESQPGDVILLSPGFASWGQFRDYRERGERFSTLARQAAAAPSTSGSDS